MRCSSAVRLYQSGQDRAAAVAANCQGEFDALERKYKGGSIPVGDLYGYRATPAYSSDFHTGGHKGQLLRAICAALSPH